ncbi:hypothetical protein B0H13DRAFT_2271872 [Mycena leptocephala]|nr:hypothetical protein B0H13DRAFT_2271872 [Mycena leptocephala]
MSLGAVNAALNTGLPIPDRLTPNYTHPMFLGAHGGNAPPPAHGSGHEEHPHPAAPPGPSPRRSTGRTPRLRLPIRPILIPTHPTTPPPPTPQCTSPPSCPCRLSRPSPPPRARYTLKTSRPSPKGFDAFFAFAKERRCLVEGYAGVWRDFAPFWRVEMGVAAQRVGKSGGRLEGIDKGGRGWFRDRVQAVEKRVNTHGIAALTIRDGRAHKPEHQVTYFDGDWEGKVNKFASALPPMTVLINGRDEPHVVFDVGPVFEDPPALTQALTLADPPSHSRPRARARSLRSRKERKDVCRPARGVGGVGDVPLGNTRLRVYFFVPDTRARSVWGRRAAGLMEGGVSRRWKAEARLSFPGRLLVSASSGAFTTDLVPVLSMTKLSDASVSVPVSGGGGAEGGGGSCFAEVLVLGAGEREWIDRVREVHMGRVLVPGTVGVSFDGAHATLLVSWVLFKSGFVDFILGGGLYGSVQIGDVGIGACPFHLIAAFLSVSTPRSLLPSPADWCGKSNGGHIRGTNYRAFPRFRLMDLAALPENRVKGMFDVRITQWHEWHCTVAVSLGCIWMRPIVESPQLFELAENGSSWFNVV